MIYEPLTVNPGHPPHRENDPAVHLLVTYNKICGNIDEMKRAQTEATLAVANHPFLGSTAGLLPCSWKMSSSGSVNTPLFAICSESGFSIQISLLLLSHVEPLNISKC